MKPVKLSHLLILTGFLFVLSAAGETGEPRDPKETKPQSKKAELQQKESAKQQTPAIEPSINNQLPHSSIDRDPSNTQTPKQEAQAVPPSDSTWWFNLSVTIFTGCLVGVGIAQVAVYKKQASYMQRGLTLERAWVAVSFDQVYTLGRPFIDLKITNTGKSPGHVKETTIVGSNVTDRDKLVLWIPGPIPADEKGTRWTIFPGETLTQRYDLLTGFEPGEIDAIADETKKFTIYGFILYEDIFGSRHRTNFYRIFSGTTSGFDGIFIIPPDAEPGQNEAT